MTKRQASRQTLERLAEAADRYVGPNGERMGSNDGIELAAYVSAYRAEITPPLRTRAEVDAEIVRHARSTYDPHTLEADGYGVLAELLREPTAPEGHRPKCIRCGKRWLPAEGIDATTVTCLSCAVAAPEGEMPLVVCPNCQWRNR